MSYTDSGYIHYKTLKQDTLVTQYLKFDKRHICIFQNQLPEKIKRDSDRTKHFLLKICNSSYGHLLLDMLEIIHNCKRHLLYCFARMIKASLSAVNETEVSTK